VREKAPGHAVEGRDVLTIGLDRSVRGAPKSSDLPSGAATPRRRGCLYQDLQTGESDYVRSPQ